MDALEKEYFDEDRTTMDEINSKLDAIMEKLGIDYQPDIEDSFDDESDSDENVKDEIEPLVS